jgi:hypothetical protein
MLYRLKECKKEEGLDVIMIRKKVVNHGVGEIQVTDEDLQANGKGGTNLYSKELVERMTKK